MTKVRSYISLIAKDAKGQTVTLGYNDVGDIEITPAVQDAIDEGYAELAPKNAEITAKPGGLQKEAGPKKKVAVSPQKVARDNAKATAAKGKGKGRAADRFADIKQNEV